MYNYASHTLEFILKTKFSLLSTTQSITNQVIALTLHLIYTKPHTITFTTSITDIILNHYFTVFTNHFDDSEKRSIKKESTNRNDRIRLMEQQKMMRKIKLYRLLFIMVKEKSIEEDISMRVHSRPD